MGLTNSSISHTLRRLREVFGDELFLRRPHGLTRKQVADDLGVGMSTLNRWITAHRDTYGAANEDLDLARENKRLRREVRPLKEEREILK